MLKSGKKKQWGWIQDEMVHSDTSARKDDERRSKSYDWRIPEERYLFSKIRNLIKGKVLLDIGCGSSPTIRCLLSPQKNGYIYVGVDISTQPMKIAHVIQYLKPKLEHTILFSKSIAICLCHVTSTLRSKA